LAELAASEIPVLEKRAEELARTVQFALLPPEPHEDRDAIMEIRAGAGGNEAALFAADLLPNVLPFRPRLEATKLSS